MRANMEANGGSHLIHGRFHGCQVLSERLYHNRLYQEMDFQWLVSSVNKFYSTLFDIDDW